MRPVVIEAILSLIGLFFTARGTGGYLRLILRKPPIETPIEYNLLVLTEIGLGIAFLLLAITHHYVLPLFPKRFGR